jgi:hypothetical protein
MLSDIYQCFGDIYYLIVRVKEYIKHASTLNMERGNPSETSVNFYKTTQKVKLSAYLIKHYAIKAYGGERRDPRIIYLGTSWR